MEDEFAIARLYYQAYGDSVEWKNFQGNPMPKFDELTLKIKLAWDATTKVQIKTDWRNLLNEREQKILKNAELYSQDAFGDNGHNLKLLVAHLSSIIDNGE